MIIDNNGACNLWRSDKTQDEIKKSFMNLKNNKANGEGGTRNEYIKATQQLMLPVYENNS